MLTRKTQYAWMAVGGLICLFGLVLACKLRDGNRAIAQSDKTSPPLPPVTEPPPLPLPPAKSEENASYPPFDSKPSEPETTPPTKIGKDELPAVKPDMPPPKGMLDMPSPPEPSPPFASDKKEPPMPPSGALPASLGVNAPTPKTEKKEKKSKPLDGFLFRKPSADPPPEKADTNLIVPPALGDATPSTKPQPPVPSPLTNREPPVTPTSFAPTSQAPPSSGHDADHELKAQPGEPPLAPAPGPVQLYHAHGSETLQDIARRTLGSSERWTELYKLNPTLKPDAPLTAGTTVRLPADACVQADDVEPVKPLPALRSKPAPAKVKTLPLTGTYQCSLDEKGRLTLPRALRDQFGDSDTVLLSPGPDKCLWLTNQRHLERLGERLEQSHVNEADVRDFKRLYFAQTEKLTINDDSRVAIPERLAQFAELHQEVVLVGIDDHFEVWDAARWRQYTQRKSAAGRAAAMAESE
jgi:MraZ protein